jgi:hypothetical protein
MSLPKRDIKKHANATQRHRLTAQECLARDRRQAQTPPEPFSKPSIPWGFLTTSWPRSKSVCGVNTSPWAKSLE